MKIVLINHTFQKEQFYKRWRILAQTHPDLDVTLLAPEKWTWGAGKRLTYGHVDVEQGVVVEDKNFRIHLIDVQTDSLGGWTSGRLEQELVTLRPDIVYFIGEHTQNVLLQLYRLRRRNRSLSSMKILAFSMRGHQHSLHIPKADRLIRYAKHVGKYIYLKRRVNALNRHCDAVFCHYPDAVSEFRREGYKGPIYMQTQVGVDPDVFYPDTAARERVRNRYGIGDAYLFGSASRFSYSKGLSEIIQALPASGNWKYLMMGWGRDDEVARIKAEIKARGLEDKIILTGYVDNWKDMAEHWNALDCAVHAPITTPEWEETFSLALVQAMITGLPVIGSSSGSVPYQIGPEGIIVPEKNIPALRRQMERMIAAPQEGKAVGARMRERALSCFSIYHLDELFYQTIQDIMNDVYDEAKADMTNALRE